MFNPINLIIILLIFFSLLTVAYALTKLAEAAKSTDSMLKTVLTIITLFKQKP